MFDYCQIFVENITIFNYNKNMENFWKRVDEELEYKGRTRISLAEECGFSVSYISKGIVRGSNPTLDLAIKIANALNVSLEYLATGSNDSLNKNKSEESEQLRLYRKHSEIIKKCEQLSPEKEKLLATIADNFEK